MKKKLICGLLCLGLCLGSAQAAGSGFADVKDTDWFAPYVDVCVANGLMNGVGGGNFNPGGTITVAEVAAIAARLGESMNGQPIIYGTAAPGETLPWYHWYVENLKGYGVTISNPETPASRQDFISFLAAVTPSAELAAINSIAALPDTADSGVLAFYNAGILTGVDSYGTFAGDKTLTRSEAAAMVSRVVEPSLRQTFVPQTAPAQQPTPQIPADGFTVMTVNGAPVSLSDFQLLLCEVIYDADYNLYLQGTRLDWNADYGVGDLRAYFLSQAQELMSANMLLAAQAQALGCSIEELPAYLAPDPDPAVLRDYAQSMDLLCAKHILVSDLNSAQAILDGLEQVPTMEQFNALLYIFGTDPGMDSNPYGYLFTAGEMVEEFEAAVRALEVGAYTQEPVQTSFGYHIIWRLDPVEHPDLVVEYQQQTAIAFLQIMLSQTQVTVDEALMDAIDLPALYEAYLLS